MNFFKRYLFKKALLEDELANEERRRKEVVIEKQPEPVEVVAKPQEKKEEIVTSQVTTKAPALKAEIDGEYHAQGFVNPEGGGV